MATQKLHSAINTSIATAAGMSANTRHDSHGG